MHRVGTSGVDVDRVMTKYDKEINALVNNAKSKYKDVSLYVFSDHGMHDIKKSVDLISIIEKLDLKFKQDYVAMYDSTMARFWFQNDKAEKEMNYLFQSRLCFRCVGYLLNLNVGY